MVRDNLDSEREWVVLALQRWLESGCANWRAIVPVVEWAEQRLDRAEEYSGWRAESSEGNFFIANDFIGFVKQALNTLNLIQHSDFVPEENLQNIFRGRHRLLGCGVEPTFGHHQWGCCRVYGSILVSLFYLGRGDDLEIPLTYLAELALEEIGRPCAGYQWLIQNARNLRRRPTSVGRDRAGIQRQKPSETLVSTNRPDLPDEIKSYVDQKIDVALRGRDQIKVGTTIACSARPASASERLWRLGTALRQYFSEQADKLVPALAAERAWKTAQSSDESEEGRSFLASRLIDAAALQPVVDPHTAEPDAMRQLLENAEPLGGPIAGHLWREAYARAARGRGWRIGVPFDERDPTGLEPALKAASLGDPDLRLVLASDAQAGTEAISGHVALELLRRGSLDRDLRAIDALASLHERGTVFADGTRLPRIPIVAAPMRRMGFLAAMPRAISGDRTAMQFVARDYFLCRWLPGDAAFKGGDLNDPALAEWRDDPIGRGARHALTWSMRAAGSDNPYSEMPDPASLPETIDSLGAGALRYASQLVRVGLGCKADAEIADTLLQRALEAGDGMAAGLLGWEKWRVWPRHPYYSSNVEDHEEESELSGIVEMLRLGRAADASAGVLLKHIVGLIVADTASDVFLDGRRDDAREAYAKAHAVGALDLEHIFLCLVGDSSDKRSVQRAWRKAVSRSSRIEPPGLVAIFGSETNQDRLDALLDFDPVRAGMLPKPQVVKGRMAGLLTAPEAVHQWLSSHEHVNLAAADWLDLRARLSMVLAEPTATSWARAAARAQLRTAGFPSLSYRGLNLETVRAREDAIDQATSDTGPIAMTLDGNGFALPGRRAVWRHSYVADSLSRLKDATCDWIGASCLRGHLPPSWTAPRGLAQPPSPPKPVYGGIDLIRIYESRTFRRPLIEVEGRIDNENGLISLEDIKVVVALAYLHIDDADDPSLSLEPLETGSETAWRFNRRVFTPRWLGATDFGRTHYISDYWLMPAAGSNFSFTQPGKVVGCFQRWTPPQPWRASHAVGGSRSYTSGMVQIHLGGVVSQDNVENIPSGFPVEVPAPRVIPIVYGAGIDARPGRSEERNLDDTWLGNRYVRTADVVSNRFAEAARAFPVFERLVRLQGLFVEVCRAARAMPLEPGTPLHTELTSLRKRYDIRWRSIHGQRDYDVVWGD